MANIPSANVSSLLVGIKGMLGDCFSLDISSYLNYTFGTGYGSMGNPGCIV
jgi:hypothetical protein